jgi:hypothetical protein
MGYVWQPFGGQHIYSQYKILLNYVHHLRNLFYFQMLPRLLGLVTLLGFGSLYVMLCQTLSIEAHESKIEVI